MACARARPRVTVAATKKTKEQVRYQWEPHRGEQCATCSMFLKPDACTDVQGPISSHGWCRIYFRKPGRLPPFAKR